MALSKGVKARIATNKARRQRWGDKPTRLYEKAMKKWHDKFGADAALYGRYSEEALACEPESPHTRWKQKHAGKPRFDSRILEKAHA
jgi:hypothetical protein